MQCGIGLISIHLSSPRSPCVCMDFLLVLWFPPSSTYAGRWINYVKFPFVPIAPGIDFGSTWI